MDYEITRNVSPPNGSEIRVKSRYNFTRIWTAIKIAEVGEWLLVRGLSQNATTAFRSLASLQTRRRFGADLRLDIRVRRQHDDSCLMYICKQKVTKDGQS